MRPSVFAFLTLVALGLAGLSGCTSADTTAGGKDVIARVWTEYRDAKSFARFGGFPNPETAPGGAVILRSQPDERTGFYFTIRLRDRVAVPDGRLVLSVITPNAAQAQSYEFSFASHDRRSLQLLAGVTGKDWPYGNTMPLAWKIQIVDRSGGIVAERQSYLWAQP